MRTEIVARQRRDHGRERPRCDGRGFAREFRLDHRVRGAVAADPALAARHGRRHGRRQPCGGRRRHGGDHRPQPPAGRRDPRVGRVHRQRDDVPCDPPVRARARVGADRHRDGLPAGRRLRGAAAGAAQGARSAPTSRSSRARARSRRRTRSRCCAACRASPIVDHRRVRGGEGRRHRDGHRRRT